MCIRDRDKRASQSRYGALEFEYTKRHLEEFIHEGADVIELGCGTGYYAMHFSSRCRTYLGVDMVPEPVSYTHLDVYKRQV